MRYAPRACLWVISLTAVLGCTEPGSENNMVMPSDVAPEDVETLARCLTNHGWVLYSSFTCPACRAQQRIFGNAFADVQTIECNPNAKNSEVEKCVQKKIRKTPTWIREQDGTEFGRLEGYQPLDVLASESTCGNSF